MRISRTTGKEAPRIEIAATVTHTRRASALSPKGLSNNPILLSLSLSLTLGDYCTLASTLSFEYSPSTADIRY